ncbi:3-hydroxyisobutyrate dehydrogenase [Rhizodiscina lignyota]|uniref:3-hydroxyisobutyrate dehydrogenase n=1 Tax=Rhizodiscina lignyota TaxID=1504668 RepID=A0A9P4MAP2_9PEZI|nr:3-hydroxyisobutyrate dehydrogenase [Rhizodiscina lignyota]
MATPAKTIAFIGLGVMGYRMAVNLRSKIDSSYKIVICDISKDAISKYQSQMKGKGEIDVVENGFEAAQAADMVITMLPDSPAVKAVYLDPKTGIIAGAVKAMSSGSKKKILMECGTIEVATILEVSKAVEEAEFKLPTGMRLTFIDSPVSGGPMGAEAGSLCLMVGSTRKEVFPEIKAVLSHMGRSDNIFLCGDVGAGTAFKVINNYISAVVSLASSEALNIGDKMGLDLKLLTDVINSSGGQTWITSNSNPVPGIHPNAPASRNYEGGFRIELCKKVLQMGTDLAEMVGARHILDKPTMEAFEEASADPRYAGKDARVVYKWLNESVKKPGGGWQ